MTNYIQMQEEKEIQLHRTFKLHEIFKQACLFKAYICVETPPSHQHKIFLRAPKILYYYVGFELLSILTDIMLICVCV